MAISSEFISTLDTFKCYLLWASDEFFTTIVKHFLDNSKWDNLFRHKKCPLKAKLSLWDDAEWWHWLGGGKFVRKYQLLKYVDRFRKKFTVLLHQKTHMCALTASPGAVSENLCGNWKT